MNNRHRIRKLKSARRSLSRQERTDWTMGFPALARIRAGEIKEVENRILELEASQPPRREIDPTFIGISFWLLVCALFAVGIIASALA